MILDIISGCNAAERVALTTNFHLVTKIKKE